MDHLSSEQLTVLRRLLGDMRDQIERRAGGDVRRDAEEAEPADLQDRAREERERAAELAFTTADRKRLDEIEAALLRMEEGTYGVCEETDEPIPFGRLQAQPTARYTVEAQELLESEAGPGDEDGGAAY